MPGRIIENCPFIYFGIQKPEELICLNRFNGRKNKHDFKINDNRDSFTKPYCGDVNHTECPFYKILHVPTSFELKGDTTC